MPTTSHPSSTTAPHTTDTEARARVLIAVSDPLTRRVLSSALYEHGFFVCATVDGDAAHLLLGSFEPDVVVTERGFGSQPPQQRSIATAARSRPATFLLLITPALEPAAAAEARVRALRDGADDAVSADAPYEEVSARCIALMRRPRTPQHGRRPAPSVLDFGPLRVDLGRRRLSIGEQEISATRLEFALFEQLCRHPAEVRSRAQLIEAVWGPNWVGDSHVVDVHLSNLRRKVQRVLPGVRLVHTVRGVGFRLSSELLRRSA